MSATALHELLDWSVRAHPERVAVEEADGSEITYRDFDALSDRVRDRLVALGVGPGDRVGLYLRKSIDTVAAIFGILKTGAAYVPVDPQAPAARNAYILNNCGVKAAFVERRFVDGLQAEMTSRGASPSLVVIDSVGGGKPLDQALSRADADGHAPIVPTARTKPDDVAYVLYTSGSTGLPKGVVISHLNALCFVDWCSEVFHPRPEDRFSSHAPFHFDLSILDLYVPLKHGAAVVVLGEELAKDAPRLGAIIGERRLTVWYSAPSILSLVAQQGHLERYDYSALRAVIFAGEVFPVKHLRLLKAQWQHPRYFNLYGPTETNVCTYYELPPEIEPDRVEPYPIGKVCAHYRSRICDPDGTPVDGEGELCIAGAGVMHGYWQLPEQTERAFFVGTDGERWYRTGDLVTEQVDGNLKFLGRRDRMIKKRGYRVELGEIESALYRHPGIQEAAVIAIQDEEHGVRVRAFVSTRDSKPLSLIELKRFCADQLPLYMVPDFFSFLPVLPKTSTDKTDYQQLKNLQ